MIFGSWARRLRGGATCVWVLMWVTGLAGANAPSQSRDTLVYKDGDRVQGKVIETSDNIIVFKSDRFGELRVSSSQAVVIKAPKSEAAEAPKPAPAPALLPVTKAEREKAVAAAERREEEERVTIWDQFSLSVLTAKVRDYFGPWRGRLTFSSEVVSDVAERNNSSYEAQLKRKWKSDEVQMSLRFDYSETNDIATTDVLKASGQWRREFTKSLFAHYRPSSEWNRASRLRGVPNDYVLLQQEIGFGYHVLATPARKVRVGVSENLFDTWNTAAATRDHSTRGVVSMFEEVDLTLPWRMTVAQRGIWYPGNDDADGWENRVELIKKLTETLSTSLRHEIRRNNPDGSAQDYTRLKLLFGLDF